MSQYRDDRAAARLRIETLEARLAEREADLARHDAELAARDEEILRLQQQLGAAWLGARRMRSVDAAWASRIVGLAGSIAVLAAGAGVSLLRASAGPPLAEPEMAQAAQVVSPIHADPVASGAFDWSAPADGPAAAPSWPPEDITAQRQVEPRVWGGRSAADDARLVNTLCPGGALAVACRERVRRAMRNGSR